MGSVVVSDDVKAYLSQNYRVNITRGGYSVRSKRSDNEIVKLRSYGKLMIWARDQRAKSMSIRIPLA